MKQINRKLRLVYLLPWATGKYLGKQIQKYRPFSFMLIFLITIMAVLFFVSIKGIAAEDNTEQGALAPLSSEENEIFEESSVMPNISSTVTLSFAGDCTLGMDQSFYYDSSLNAMYDQQGASYFLQNVKDIFSQDDLTVINFEGTLTESLARADKDWAFKGPFEYVDILTEGSVEAANLANNHSCDYVYRSFFDTQETLENAGVTVFGYDDIKIIEINGVKVGLIGMYTVYDDDGYIAELQSYIADLQGQGAQLIIANFHWGTENSTQPEDSQIELAHAAIDAGAHLVVGHHPHVLQGIEEYNGRFVVYSLGNFCFGGNSDPPDYDTMIFQQTFTITGGEVSTESPATIIPCSISSVSWKNDYCPTPAVGEEYTRIIEKLSDRSASLGDINAIEIVLK